MIDHSFYYFVLLVPSKKSTGHGGFCSVSLLPWVCLPGPMVLDPWSILFVLKPMTIMAQIKDLKEDRVKYGNYNVNRHRLWIVSHPAGILRPGHLYKGPEEAGGRPRWDLACNPSFVSIIQSDLPCLSVYLRVHPMHLFLWSSPSSKDIVEDYPRQL
jgi:hypothetical protein